MTEVVVEQHIKATPSTVYRYLTESDKWLKWQSASADLDARPGGVFALTMENGMLTRGQYTELVPDKRVVFTWGWVDHPGLPPGSSMVTVDLEAVEDGTLLVLTHSNLPPDEVEAHRKGWNMFIPALAEVASEEE